ncbi:MAG: hydrogenase small subunit [gamma proteobacterium symbiont of Taylorina sp.]|nr:hydrogenase small subunit [gamma proteobacterium symbiont of Taylorina sp.]
MFTQDSLGKILKSHGVSRRGFIKFCSTLTSMLALHPAMAAKVAESLEKVQRPSVIWLHFQECTGCSESLTRSHAPTIESLIFDYISLDYHETLLAAAGDAAEKAMHEAMQAHKGKYLLVVEGSIPLANPGFSTVGGQSNLDVLQNVAKDAAAVIAVGSCASFGGLPNADPNPTGAVSVSDIIKDKPIINISGCPPIPVVITGVLAHFLTFGVLPELDNLGRPKTFYANTIHDRCYRRPFYDKGLFAETFDDEGAKKGWCLYRLGCKGPTTYNACATVKWNDQTSWPVEAGHGCLGCSEPRFWDGGGFYKALSLPDSDVRKMAGYAVATGLAAGAIAGIANKIKKQDMLKQHEVVSVDDWDDKS